MASISKPLNGERRLFELLEEQQEPFLLDVYLLENGYSDNKMFDSHSQSLCWPSIIACKTLKRMSTNTFRRRTRRRRLSFFRCIVRKALDWSHHQSDCKALKFDRLSFSGDDSSPSSPVSVLDLNSNDYSSLKDDYDDRKFDLFEELIMKTSCEKEKDKEKAMESIESERRDISNVSNLIALDVLKSNKEWNHFEHEIKEIGMQIEAEIFEELVLDLLGF
ncbi:hypothetical protein IHE45_08G018900 [Dioscorea alata]|uniref:Uncharacterized protein n=1 Tax=Dioscorea alata TaxID=55571 RepID=A0ACB7VHL6_DIOAL|nr:hypothetical protein IHE45_08G018900 [Dioscorea alata]